MIKINLFWKILLGFWVILVLVLQLSWVVYYIKIGDHESRERYFASEIAPAYLNAAKYLVEKEGIPAFTQFLQQLPEEQRRLISLHSESEIYSPDSYSIIHLQDADGKQWQLVYQLPPKSSNWSKENLYRILAAPLDPEWSISGAIGGLIFSSFLAWYLTRPINQFRRAFKRLAQGDFSTPLKPTMGRRNDELSDMATDFDQMSQRIQTLILMRDQLLHDVSHEIRSPLARLNLAIALIQKDPDNIQNSLKRIELEVNRLDQLVQELLSLSRLENYSHNEDNYFDLLELLHVIVKDAIFETTVSNIQVILHPLLDIQEVLIRGNAEVIRRGIENIVRNAIKFSPNSSLIHLNLSLDAHEQNIHLVVMDEGPGVPEEQLKMIFEPFIRLNHSIGKAKPSYGLGLSIAQRAFIAHGGNVVAYNRKPHGLACHIVLPYIK